MVNGSRWMVRRRILILVSSIVILSLLSSALVAKFGSPLRCEFFSLCNKKNFPSLSSIPVSLLRGLPNKDHHHLAGPEEEEEIPPPPPPPPELAPADDLPQSVVQLDPPLQYYTSDDELTAHVLAQDILSRPTLSLSVEQAKVAFMFMTPGALPFEAIWEKFFEGHEGKYSVYVHASEKASLGSIWKSKVFKGREIRSEKRNALMARAVAQGPGLKIKECPPLRAFLYIKKQVLWGQIAMVDAERRLLANALQDLHNQYFVLLSETCIPLHGFNYIYNYLLGARMSFVDCFDDPGPHGLGRYMDSMMPEIHKSVWRKGAQWFAVNRQHALLVVADNLYYRKFSSFCKPGPENHNCYPDEHYVQTFLHIMDPSNLANWTVTHVDWSERKWHPKSYTIGDVTETTFAAIQAINKHVHITSDGEDKKTTVPCLWNGEQRPCFLFARKFLPETADVLSQLLPKSAWQRSQPAL